MLREKNKTGHGFLLLIVLAVVAAIWAATAVHVSALENGAYLVGRTTSYADPRTGQTVDGGTDIALGDSMCASIIQDDVLIEKVDGTTYVTLGLGLASNIDQSSIKIYTEQSDGSLKSMPLTHTGSCTRDGDTCNHYRFQMNDTDKLISVAMFVTPMGREVQFFCDLDMNSATPGTGNYASEMVAAAEEEAKAEAEAEAQAQAEEEAKAKAEAEQDEKEAEEKAKAEAEKEAEQAKKNKIIIGVVTGVVILAAASGGFYVYRRKRK